MTDEELNALMFEQDRLFAELEAQVGRRAITAAAKVVTWAGTWRMSQPS